MEDYTDAYKDFFDNHKIITQQFHSLNQELSKCYQIIQDLDRENEQLKSKMNKTLCIVKGILKDYCK